MKLRGIEFGNIWGASGVQSFDGEGYAFHSILQALGLLSFAESTFVAKTVTLKGTVGNMKLDGNSQPIHFWPNCIKAKLLRGNALNSVGLSNFGIGYYLGFKTWQERTEPFLLSLMSTAPNKEQRLIEFKIMAEMLHLEKPNFKAPFAIQVNLSCPNTGHDPKTLMSEVDETLEILSIIDVPLVPKFSIASAPIAAMLELDTNPHCDAICVSNTLPFGWEELDQKQIWGSDTSPLSHIGGGGLSGNILRALVCEYIGNLRSAGFNKPINGGGGILHPNDVYSYAAAGANSIFVGSVVMLRPWRLKSIIKQANKLTWR